MLCVLVIVECCQISAADEVEHIELGVPLWLKSIIC